LCISAPITVALGGSAMAYAIVTGNIPITTLIQTTFGGLATFRCWPSRSSCWPANLMNEGGITPDLVRFARLLFGTHQGRPGPCHHSGLRHLRGHLRGRRGDGGRHRRRHDPGHEGGRLRRRLGRRHNVCGLLHGPIIPPSIPFIIYGVTANVSVGALFLAGFSPVCSWARP